MAINGQHFTEFTHRVPAERITHITISGDVTISFIQFDGPTNVGSAASSPPVESYHDGGVRASAPGLPETAASAPPAWPAIRLY